MREIKLRFWDKENNCMVYQNKESLYPLSLYKIVCDCFTNFQFRLFKLKNNNLNQFEEVESVKMQYTGLKDLNGTKVYEGDIIPYHFNKNIKGVVKFGEYKSPCDDKFTKHQGFYIDFDGESKDYYRKDLGYWATLSEVIGNIYENPELMEGI